MVRTRRRAAVAAASAPAALAAVATTAVTDGERDEGGIEDPQKNSAPPGSEAPTPRSNPHLPHAKRKANDAGHAGDDHTNHCEPPSSSSSPPRTRTTKAAHRSLWDTLSVELQHMILQATDFATRLMNGLPASRPRRQTPEQDRAVWCQVFDGDWVPPRSAEPVLRPHATLEHCGHRDFWRVRSRDMFSYVRRQERLSLAAKRGLVEVALRNGWLDLLDGPDGLEVTAAEIGRADLSVDTIESLLRYFRFGLSLALAEGCAATGRIETIQWLWSRPRMPGRWKKSIMDIAAGEGHLPLVEWLHVNVPTGCTAAAMDSAAENGHLEVVEFLHRNSMEGCTGRALNGAVANGHISVARFLFEATRVSTVAGDGLYKAAAKGYLEMIKMALDRGAFVRDELMLYSAACGGHLDVVKFFNDRVRICGARVMSGAASGGHLEVVKFLHSHRPEGFTDDAMNNAAQNGHLDVVEFLHSRNERCTRFDGALLNGYIDVVKFFIEKRNQYPPNSAITHALFNAGGYSNTAYRYVSPDAAAAVFELNLHKRLSVQDVILAPADAPPERLARLLEDWTDAARRDLALSAATVGCSAVLSVLQTRWPESLEAVSLDLFLHPAQTPGPPRSWLPHRRSLAAADAARAAVLECLFRARPALFSAAPAGDPDANLDPDAAAKLAAVVDAAVDRGNFAVLAWFARRAPDAFAAHPRCRVLRGDGGEPATEAVELMAACKVAWPYEGVIIAGKKKCRQALQWLRETYGATDPKVEQRAKWYLQRMPKGGR